jgi:hypothetical protein
VGVAGSNPVVPTNYFNDLCCIFNPFRNRVFHWKCAGSAKYALETGNFFLSRHAASLVEPKDGQSRFELLEAIRALYRKRAKMLALARAIGLVSSSVIAVLAGIR